MPGPPGVLRATEAWKGLTSFSGETVRGPTERGGNLFVVVRRTIVRQSLQLLQGLQIELLIAALRLSGLFP